MSNLAIQRTPFGPTGMLPPGLEADYAHVRQSPLFEGVPNEDLIAAMSQGGIAVRQLERDMFVLDPIGLAHGQPAPVVFLAAGQVAAAVFVEQELADRRELGYPPYSRIALVRIDDAEEQVARVEADRLATIGRRKAPAGADVIGPAPAPLARLRGRFRYRFLVRAPTRGALRQVLFAIAAALPDRRTRVIIDVDPVNML
jgi:hypothetical protein